jgi:hypothetical protein
MMVFLFDTYGGITQNDLVDNTKNLAEPFYPAQPIYSLFCTIQNAADYADANHGMNHIIAQTYTHLLNSGVLLDACEKWNAHPIT